MCSRICQRRRNVVVQHRCSATRHHSPSSISIVTMEASMSSPPNGGHAEGDPWNQALVQVAHVWQMDHNLRHVQYCLQYLQATEQKLIHYLEARESRIAPPPPENGSDPAATVESRSFWDGPLPHQVSPPRFDPSRPLRRQSSRRRRD
jgi:hypothetical protein